MTTIESMAAQLNALDVPMTEEQTIGRIIASLPDEYQNFETTWDSMANSEKTLENLRSRLVQEEKKHKRKRDASRMRERDLQPPRSDQLVYIIPHSNLRVVVPDCRSTRKNQVNNLKTFFSKPSSWSF